MAWRRHTAWAAACAVAAAITAGLAGVEAFRLEPVARVAEERPGPPLPEPAALHLPSEQDVLQAVARNPFTADRRSPPGRFPAGGEAASGAVPSPVVAAPPAIPRLVGTTVLGPARGFALIALGDAGPELVHLGASLGPWKLVELAAGRVVLESPDSSMALQIEGRQH